VQSLMQIRKTRVKLSTVECSIVNSGCALVDGVVYLDRVLEVVVV
jgi:hypothetical protein